MKKTALIVLMLVLASLVLLPFLWTAATSFKPLTEVNKHPPEWFSPNMSFEPYRDMFFYLPFSDYTVEQPCCCRCRHGAHASDGKSGRLRVCTVQIPGESGRCF